MELENDNKKLNNIISNNPELKKMLENINEGNKRLSLMRQSFDVQKSVDNNKSLNDSKVKTKTEQNNIEQLRLTQKMEQDNIDLMTMQKQRDMLKLQLENARVEAENKDVQLESLVSVKGGTLIDAHLDEVKRFKAECERVTKENIDLQAEQDKTLQAIEEDEALITDKNATIECLQRKLKK